MSSNQIRIELLLVFSFLVLLSIILISNNLYATESSEKNALLLTRDVVLNKEYKNRVVRLDATVIKEYVNNDNGIKSIYLQSGLPKEIQITVFPSLGVTAKFLAGDKVTVVGTVQEYKEKLQIRPLSKNTIRKTSTLMKCTNAIHPAAISQSIGVSVEIIG